jgi:hypothetical protein
MYVTVMLFMCFMPMLIMMLCISCMFYMYFVQNGGYAVSVLIRFTKLQTSEYNNVIINLFSPNRPSPCLMMLI